MTNPASASPVKKYALPILWALFILFACGAHPGTLATLHLSDLFAYDKPIHALLFGTQAWLIIRSRRADVADMKKLAAAACIASALYGALIEVMQLFIFEGRSYDYYDMVADAFGTLVVWVWLQRKAARKEVTG